MTDMTSKSRQEGQRGYIIHTGPLGDIIEHYQKHGGSSFPAMLCFVETLLPS